MYIVFFSQVFELLYWIKEMNIVILEILSIKIKFSLNLKRYQSKLLNNCFCTYIIGHYNLASHTTYIVYVNFIHEWRDLQFKVDSERQIFEKLFMAILFALSFCQKSAEEIAVEIFSFDI